MQQLAFITGFIRAHEGGLSLDKLDTGNWHHGVLVGSKFGVTGDALARFRGVPAVSAADIANLTIEEAAQIGLSLYYQTPHLDLLPWNRVTASVLDMGWGAGPGQAVKLLQRILHVEDDGHCGASTAANCNAWVKRVGEEQAAREYGAARDAFYDQIIAIHPTNAKFRNGWRNRTASFLPATAWWNAWDAA